MNILLKNRIQSGISNFLFNAEPGETKIPEKEKLELEKYGRLIKVARKQMIYQEGEPPKGVYFLKKGKVKISQLNYDGAVQILFIYCAGELFGHRSILGNDRQPVTATALEDCELIFVEKEYFINVLKSSPDLSEALLQSMSHEFTTLVNRINVFAQRGIKERLALFLLILNETFKIPGQLAEESEITLNRNDLAAYTGTSVENLVRTLKMFRENGYVRVNGKTIYIENFEALFTISGL